MIEGEEVHKEEYLIPQGVRGERST